ncbi:MAG: NADH:flavin oxidoreductase [Parvularcula sp.]|jgi:2,4-dienoyl-CoA reductase-like NADH-dependent reductase (Old Yellow Enzyme family)|nr:NADH:flavin oxidoreductase [Parvularcula sp.]
MFKPEPRIRWESQPGRWPTAEEAAASQLFAPIEVGPLTLSSRTWVPAMVPWRASEEGFVTDDVVSWYRRFAEGKPGAIVIEATGVRDVPSGPLLRAADDRFIPGLRRIADAVREASGNETKLLVQLIDFLRIRRRPPPSLFFSRFLEVTEHHRAALDLPRGDDETVRTALAGLDRETLETILTPRELEALDYGARERVTDTDLPHIRELPQNLPDLFAAAAKRCVEAGFDGIELHCAHAYTLASFLSATNQRDDGYGRTREGRVRLPLEVYGAVRASVPQDIAVGARFLTTDCIDGGSTPNDAAWFGSQFAKAGMDFLSLSRGGKFDDAKQPKVGQPAYPYTGPSGYECMPAYISDEAGPFSRNIPDTKLVRDAVRKAGYSTPIVAAGGLHSYEQALAWLDEGAADIVSAARQSLADPDWFEKMRQGRGKEIRVCEYTNYCEGLDQSHKQVTCKLWDRTDIDAPDAELSSDGKRRLTAPAWR